MKRINLLSAFFLVLGCADRTVGETWAERVDESCEAFCEVAVCNPHNANYQDPAGCESDCKSGGDLAVGDACGEATLAHVECLGALTCDEAIAMSEAIAAGEVDDFACRDELITRQDECSQG